MAGPAGGTGSAVWPARGARGLRFAEVLLPSEAGARRRYGFQPAPKTAANRDRLRKLTGARPISPARPAGSGRMGRDGMGWGGVVRDGAIYSRVCLSGEMTYVSVSVRT